MKKFYSAALSILLILGFILTGCNGDSTTMTSSTKTPSSTTSPPAAATTTPTTTPAITPTTTPTTTPFTPAAADPLRFPVDDYTVETKTVSTSEGDKEVTYHFYENITYVENPVDADYQSMNIKVPVNIDGVDIDATNAPIYLEVIASAYLATQTGSRISNPNANLALAEGYVMISPGCRGWNNETDEGIYYGKAPAGIVDLKCAVKYIRYNDGLMPGNAEWIIAGGFSGGGAMTALLGASGNSDLYDAYFEELGAADADDNIFAGAPYCPITDLKHADIAYEWEFGTIPLDDSGLVDQDLSAQLIHTFTGYQAMLDLEGKNGFGTITADNYADYLLQTYLVPSADNYLSALTDTERADYLAENPWITWANDTASFTWADYVTHAGRMKGLPAFDNFDLEEAENKLFGNETTNARHFTTFSLRYTSGDDDAEIDSDLPDTLDMMNPMYFISANNSGCADYWWIRHGTSDTHTSLPVIINLATALENLGKDVNTLLYWDTGHAKNKDAEDFIDWVGSITGYTG